jgi:type I restriction enzyme S subunit
MHDMKDSGVAWIGAVPSGYRTASIGSLFTIKKDIIGREPETVLSITQTGIRPKDLSSNEGQNASSYAHYQIVNMGDFAMNHMDLLTGWIDISKYEGVTSPDYRVFTLNDKEMSADYFLRVFQYYYTNKVFFGFGQGVATLGRWRLPAINFKKIDVPVPPVLEQQRIVSAIDEKVGKVDALIANVQTQIEKLKAYKQSMITEVVTKGLDPSVPMKNSGVDVYPSVPEHWNVQKTLTTLTMPITDGPHTTPELLSEGIPFVSAEAVSCGNGGIDFDHIRGFISREFYDECSKKYVPQRDDIYMIKSGATTGRVSVVDTDRIFTIWSPLAVFRCNPDVVHFRFLYYFLQSSAYQRQVQFGWTYGTQQNIGMRTLERLKVFVPPFDEQYAITECLDAKCIQIDRLVAIKQAKIEKLEQYKRSLIYEYVTGKK